MHGFGVVQLLFAYLHILPLDPATCITVRDCICSTEHFLHTRSLGKMRASVILPSLAALITISAAASIPGLPSCAGSCVGTDFGGCGSLNVQCICSNTALISSLACCVSTACDQADQEG